jgi:hypothetical protein
VGVVIKSARLQEIPPFALYWRLKELNDELKYEFCELGPALKERLKVASDPGAVCIAVPIVP